MLQCVTLTTKLVINMCFCLLFTTFIHGFINHLRTLYFFIYRIGLQICLLCCLDFFFVCVCLNHVALSFLPLCFIIYFYLFHQLGFFFLFSD